MESQSTVNPFLNEPAFPVTGMTVDASGAFCGQTIQSHGLSLRDYFAAKAMNGLAESILINNHVEQVLQKLGIKPSEFPAYLARMSYDMADAMLTARKS